MDTLKYGNDLDHLNLKEYHDDLHDFILFVSYELLHFMLNGMGLILLLLFEILVIFENLLNHNLFLLKRNPILKLSIVFYNFALFYSFLFNIFIIKLANKNIFILILHV